MLAHPLLLVLAALLVACAPPAPNPTPTAPLAAAPTPTAAAVPTPTAVSKSVAAPTPAPPLVKLLRFATHADDKNLTPWTQGTGYPGYYMMTLVYDTLFWPDPKNQPQPWLVKSYDLSADGRRWTLRLHDGVKWHDGRPLTSEDVKFTFDYLTRYPRPRFTPTFRAIEQITTPDPLTVVIHLKEADASFLWRPLADLPIVPKHVWEGIDKPLDQTTQLPIGSGPYRLVELQPGQSYRFVANPDYFKGRPIVEELVMPVIAQPATTYQALRAGEIDAMSLNLGPELVPEFERAGGVKVLRGPDFRGWYLYFNTQRPPFDRREVRQAVAATVDVAALTDTLLLGLGVPGAPGFVHPAVPWANPALKHRRDVHRARTLLEGAGIKDLNGDGVRELPDGRPFEFELLVASNQPLAIRAAELISGWAAEAGIKLKPVALEGASNRIWPDEQWGQFKGDYFLGIHSWASSVHLDPNFLRDMFHSDPAIGGFNRAAYKNPTYDALALEQARTTDPERRRQLLFRLQELLAEDVPMLPLYYPDGLHAYRPAAFDRWVYYDGVGILNKATFLPGAAAGR